MTATYKIPTYHVQLVREPLTLTSSTPDDAVGPLRSLCCERGDREVMAVLYLDGVNHVLGAEVVAMGAMHGLVTDAKSILRGALIAGADGIVLGHNHPSGVLTPSPADLAMTRAVAKAGDLIGVPLLDHVIFSDTDHRSMLEAGELEPVTNQLEAP